MSLFLHNTLTDKTQEFTSIIPGVVTMYNCGPTVYNYAHIGNLRAYVFVDVLRRTLEYLGYEVKQVMNITDVGHLSSDADSGEDKMTGALKREGKPLSLEAMKELGEFYTQAFLGDLEKLNIKRPETLVKASDHIPDDIEFIKKLEVNGFIYKISDGVYFDVGKLSDYGRLGGLNQEQTESRVRPNPEKRDYRDFTLWKFNENLGWESPWGKGFPGWHIECSAMSNKYLGQPFDIHTGGIDHIPVHHNNEIAQGEAAFDKIPAKIWLHNAYLTIGGGKMAKSSGDFMTLSTLERAGFSPLVARFWLLGARYSTPIVYPTDGPIGAKDAYEKIRNAFLLLGTETGKKIEGYQEKFKQALENDLNTPVAISTLWEVLNDSGQSAPDKRATLLDFDRVLGLGLADLKVKRIPVEIMTLVNERELARKKEDWNLSDNLREQIKAKGFEVKDTEDGPVIRGLRL